MYVQKSVGICLGRQNLFKFSSHVIVSTLITTLLPPQVSINFSRDKDLPGSNTSVHLQAAPDSFCALRAVDKSALLLNHGQEMTPESVSSIVPQCPQAVWLQGLPFLGCFYLGRDMLKESSLYFCAPFSVISMG
jgi:hypothetical protein